MIDFSNCSIAKLKTLFGLKSMDPPIPFYEFLRKHHNQLKTLVENNQIIVLNDSGYEVEKIIWEEYIIQYYKNHGQLLITHDVPEKVIKYVSHDDDDDDDDLLF